MRIPINDQSIQRLHAMTRGQIWDARQYKEKDGDIIERYLQQCSLASIASSPVVN